MYIGMCEEPKQGAAVHKRRESSEGRGAVGESKTWDVPDVGSSTASHHLTRVAMAATSDGVPCRVQCHTPLSLAKFVLTESRRPTKGRRPVHVTNAVCSSGVQRRGLGVWVHIAYVPLVGPHDLLHASYRTRLRHVYCVRLPSFHKPCT